MLTGSEDANQDNQALVFSLLSSRCSGAAVGTTGPQRRRSEGEPDGLFSASPSSGVFKDTSKRSRLIGKTPLCLKVSMRVWKIYLHMSLSTVLHSNTTPLWMTSWPLEVQIKKDKRRTAVWIYNDSPDPHISKYIQASENVQSFYIKKICIYKNIHIYTDIYINIHTCIVCIYLCKYICVYMYIFLKSQISCKTNVLIEIINTWRHYYYWRITL